MQAAVFQEICLITKQTVNVFHTGFINDLQGCTQEPFPQRIDPIPAQQLIAQNLKGLDNLQLTVWKQKVWPRAVMEKLTRQLKALNGKGKCKGKMTPWKCGMLL